MIKLLIPEQLAIPGVLLVFPCNIPILMLKQFSQDGSSTAVHFKITEHKCKTMKDTHIQWDICFTATF